MPVCSCYLQGRQPTPPHSIPQEQQESSSSTIQRSCGHKTRTEFPEEPTDTGRTHKPLLIICAAATLVTPPTWPPPDRARTREKLSPALFNLSSSRSRAWWRHKGSRTNQNATLNMWPLRGQSSGESKTPSNVCVCVCVGWYLHPHQDRRGDRQSVSMNMNSSMSPDATTDLQF